ncbi:neuronal acetylcholine receptor subunit beta-4-like [Saccostrea echinata]|uniref:neuronal acetylcholine receptor subunit beta-4-like n=1 Tax=Saccostrea echinata TaxID=191078 RepID=UPI002A839BAB|nr:neuronal acetylcholine receptor subunit beta-4-like [Saccostrea echinata]
MSITSVHEVEEQLQYISFYAWFNVQWEDEFLTWNETENSGIEMIVVPFQKVWVPDLSIYNSEDNLYETGAHSFVTVKSNGQLIWFPGGKFVVTCELKMKNFPFDKQTCTIIVSPWLLTDYMQRLIPTQRPSYNLNNISENGEWEFTKFSYSLIYDKEFDQTLLIYELHLKRRYLYFVLTTLVPIIAMAVLSSMTFVIPLESGERIQYSLTLLLAFTVFLTLFEQTMPQNSTDVPYLSVYVGFQLLLCVMSTIVSVATTSKKHKYKPKETKSNNGLSVPQSRHKAVNGNPDNTLDTNVREFDYEDHSYNEASDENAFECRTNCAMILINSVLQFLSTAILFVLFWI